MFVFSSHFVVVVCVEGFERKRHALHLCAISNECSVELFAYILTLILCETFMRVWCFVLT